MLPPDNHVHSEWSWDTGAAASMDRTCAEAVRLGLPAVAFTEHVDFTRWAASDPLAEHPLTISRPGVQPLDVTGYQESVQRCRDRYPQLRIVAGIEAGEPHLFAGSVAEVLKSAPFDRVLGSLHSLEYEGRLADSIWLYSQLPADQVLRRYFAAMLPLVEGSDVFEVLAHCDYPRRRWPASAGPYDEGAFEEEYRAVFRALARSGRVLEINTASPLASAGLVRWWYEEGGGAVSFGSDAHQPLAVGQRFALAVDVAEAAGFRPGRDRFDFWRR